MQERPLRIALSTDVQRRLQEAAVHQGASMEALAQQWLLEGLERLEAARACEAREVEEAGRCSVRTGIKTRGPNPLPLQQ
ncbi:MAG: hypothetical protein VKI81_09820 [Synechococcaceae cyanobacterium]|nr:hypothetical protein [Synechococcaceae cyanobacterium]